MNWLSRESVLRPPNHSSVQGCRLTGWNSVKVNIASPPPVERFLFKHRPEGFSRLGAGDQVAAGRRVLRSGTEEEPEIVSLLQPGAMPRIGLPDPFDRRAVSRLDHEMLHPSSPFLQLLSSTSNRRADMM